MVEDLHEEIEEVVLVDEMNNVLGTLPKSVVHNKETPLHRAFSVYLFNMNRELLIQQRSHLKRSWPLVWSNSCCGHPQLNESTIDAAKRRIKEELGLEIDFIEEVADYRYRAYKDGITENEICPILIAFTSSSSLFLNDDEVEAVRWLRWPDFLDTLRQDHLNFSPWCLEQSAILEKNIRFKELRKNHALAS